MSIKDYLAGAKQAGSVQKLMTPGLAVEFIQPWRGIYPALVHPAFYDTFYHRYCCRRYRLHIHRNACRHHSRDERDVWRAGPHRKAR